MRPAVEQAQHLRLLDGALELPARDDVGEVEQGAGHGGAGMPSRVVMSWGRSVGVAWATMPRRERADCSGNEISVLAPLSARSPRSPAAVRWLATAREPYASTAAIERPRPVRRVADGVDAAVDAVEAAGRDAVPHRARRQPGQLQLIKGDHPVLPSCKLADAHIARGSRKIRPHTGRIFRDPLPGPGLVLHRCC